ncbi:MAG: histidine kinase dimerization/phospho-acceptor domain-containing protein, partial [Candidatus Moraniibacteriota bacterium]
MENLFCVKDGPLFWVYAKDVPNILYYSHVPAAIISLMMGIFIFLSNRKLLGKILFSLTFAFSLWSFLDLILWAQNDSSMVMFFWAMIILVEEFIFIMGLYLTYVFISNKDASSIKKIIIGILFLPAIILTSTKFNLLGFNLSECVSIEGFMALNYGYILEMVLIFLIVIVSFVGYFKQKDIVIKKQIAYFSLGMILFLFSFAGANLISSLTGTDLGWEYGNYGLFGMPIFIGFLAYLIVRYKAFDIKLMAVQALVIAMIILIGSQFFFIRNFTNKVLTGITIVLSGVGGYMLIRSVKKEVQKNEELALANAEINERKEQLQKISDSLAVSNDRLKQLDTAKTEFISMASHQLRTPVTGIKGYLSMLLEGSYGEVTSEQKVAMQKAYDSNERMVTLIEDLLNVSRIESGRLEYVFAKTKIEDLCQEVVNILFPKA